jgi:hypothetical protein
VYAREYNKLYKPKNKRKCMVVFIQYILTVLIAYSGLIAGTIISYAATEELKPGKLFFTITKNGLIALIIAIILTKFHIAIPIIAAFALFTFLHFVPTKIRWIYISSAIFLGLTAKNNALLIIQAIQIFLLGTIYVALEYKEKDSLKINLRRIVKETYPFLIIAIVLFFLPF